MKIFRVEIKLVTDFHTAGDTRGSTIDVLRSARIKEENDKPAEELIIPASHIKGVLRHEATRLGIDKEKIDNFFGVEEQEARGGGYKEPLLKFFDLYAPMKLLNERVHVKISINHGSSSGQEGGLHSKKVVPSGTVFRGYIAAKGSISDDDMKLINASIRSAEHYGIGGERSRGLGGFEMSIKEIDTVSFKKEVFS